MLQLSPDGEWHFGFKSTREVFVSSKKLFCCDLTMSIMVLVIVAHQLFYENQYMKFTEPESTHHTFLESPDRLPSMELLDYCLVPGKTNVSRLGNVRSPCEFLDNLDAGIEHGNDNSMLETHIRELNQVATCNASIANDFSCRLIYEVEKSRSYYVADVENFRLVIDHAVSVSDLKLETNAFDNAGQLEYKDKPARKIPFKSEGLYPFAYSDQWGDHLRVSDLLVAAGVDLDKDRNVLGECRRDSGMIIRVTVMYSNTVPWNIFIGDGKTRYTYALESVRTPRYELKEMHGSEKVLGAVSTRRLEIRSRGIYFDIRVRGKFGRFSMSAVMVWMASTLAVLNLMDFIMIKLAMNKMFMGVEAAEHVKRSFTYFLSTSASEHDKSSQAYPVVRAVVGDRLAQILLPKVTESDTDESASSEEDMEAQGQRNLVLNQTKSRS